MWNLKTQKKSRNNGWQRGTGMGKMGEGKGKVQASSFGMNKSQGWNISIKNIVNGIVIVFVWWQMAATLVIIVCRLRESLCCTPETNTTLYVNYTSIKTTTQIILKYKCRHRYALLANVGHKPKGKLILPLPVSVS